MVLTGQSPRGDAGLAPAADQPSAVLTLGRSLTPSCLGPNEHLTGDLAERAELAHLLAGRRSTAALDQAHPHVTFSLLHWVLDTWVDEPAREVFRRGAALLADRYRELGLHQLLPIDRVWVGVRSTQPDAFGGFHYPNQGYRHVQLASVITRYGRLSDPRLASAELVALDLIRSYAHDCLHWGSFREYRLQDGQPIRSRYGINWRDPQGRTYSAPDPDDAVSTRNLGIVMEGATDREARTIAATVADHLGLAERIAPPDRLAFRDTTGRLEPSDFDHAEPGIATRFHLAMAGYEHGVGARYQHFLSEVGGADPRILHGLIVAAMISGDLSGLTGWLDQQHGHGAFRRIFRSPAYTGPDPGE
ncbi:hypothetical protein [Kitasatospora kifunensis]|uniref:Uncharacterized protein n=1 Tax=Kitasatospora kifunensis TaxID=58351 RepID=A0A7W7VVR6_KITKI|nr:hypothetical protein [Kitasatospora kifunensis]MBB4923775.1 hypothetical protein [Kitasatospora kifunensis]